MGTDASAHNPPDPHQVGYNYLYKYTYIHIYYSSIFIYITQPTWSSLSGLQLILAVNLFWPTTYLQPILAYNLLWP